MAKAIKKAVKKTAKKVVKKVLDSTDLDEKLIAEYKDNKSKYDLILCYLKCYGGYVLAVGAGCLFGVNTIAATSFLLASIVMAISTTCKCKPCKGGTCKSGICSND